MGISFGILSVGGLVAWLGFALALGVRTQRPAARRAAWVHALAVVLFTLYLFGPAYVFRDPSVGPGERPVDPMLVKDALFLLFLAVQVVAMGLSWRAGADDN